MEIRSQTGLRGLAALVVALGHLPLDQFFVEEYPWLHRLLFGAQAVDLFFMLSGFILAYVYLKPDGEMKTGWKRFHWARFARIYPLHLATLVAIGGLGLVMARFGMVEGANYQLGHLPAQLLLVQAYPFVESPTWNLQSWSISIEYFCYLFLFPLGTVLLRGVRLKPVWVAVFLAVSISWTVYYLSFVLPAGSTVASGWPAVLRGFNGFAGGFLLHRLLAAGHGEGLVRLLQKHATALFGLFAGMVVVTGMTPLPQWFLLPLYPFMLLAVSRDGQSLVHRLLQSKPLHWAGLISYSIYMLFTLVAKVMGTLLRKFQPDFGFVTRHVLGLLMILTLLLVAHLSYRFFEMPVRDALLRLAGRKRERGGEGEITSTPAAAAD